MRIVSILFFTLVLRVVAQSASTSVDVGPSSINSMVTTQSGHSASDAPTPTIFDPENTDTATSTSTTLPPTGTSPPPVGGGATCVQFCLAKAAAQAGCNGIADVPCICQSRVYISTAQDCFKSSTCENADVQSAIGDYGTVCRGGNNPGGNQSSHTISSTPSTKSYTGPLASPTTQTLVMVSGVATTLSGGLATTFTSEFTTIRTGQAGDFATGSAVAPEPGASEVASNGATIAHPMAGSCGVTAAILSAISGAVVLFV